MSSRLEYNKKILTLLQEEIEKNPDLRFSQILRNLLIVKETRPVKAETGTTLNLNWENEFYLEPKDLLKRILDFKT